MKLRVTAIAIAGALCVSAGTAQAADGLLIVQKTIGGMGAPTTSQVQIDSTRMRAESTGPTGGKQIVMFDGTKQVLTMIDPDRKTYTELTRTDVEAFGGQMAAAMSQLQEQMKTMPPEQRAQMEAMMKGRGMSPAAPSKKFYKKVGTDTVGKWTCVKYEGYTGAEKTSDICTVDPKVLGFAASDFEVSKQMAAFFKKIVPGMADQMFTIGSAEEQGFTGVPVKQTFTIAGRQVTTEMTEVSRQAIPDSAFQVPAGYQKTPFGMPGRGRR